MCWYVSLFSPSLAFRLIIINHVPKAQTEELHNLIRTYITQRLSQSNSADQSVSSRLGANDEGDLHTTPLDVEKHSLPSPFKMSEKTAWTAQEMGIPEPDGAGGLVLPPLPIDKTHLSSEQAGLAEGRPEFPADQTSNKDSSSQPKDTMTSRPKRPSEMLPEIGRLTREIIRTGEEKVALAVGAYNAVNNQ